MGINGSTQIWGSFFDIIVQIATSSQNNSSRIYSKDSNNQRTSQNYIGDNSRLPLFYEDLQEMYKLSNKDVKKFIKMIEERVSEIYMAISRQTLTSMNHEEIEAQQSKIIISEEILSLNLSILKVIGRNTNFKYDKETFKELNNFQTHLVGYLKTKYPRGQQTFVSGDLMKLFKEFDKVNDLDYDILKNSNTYFGAPDDHKIIKGVKLFINKIINECDKYFPEFQKLMQEQAFFLKNEEGEKTNMNYKIGRKIPDNVAKYENLNSGVLQIFSPQIFRVLIKWMQDLEETIQNTSEKISKKQSFKCYVGEKPIANSNVNHNFGKEEKEHLFVYVNQYEYDKIVDKLISRIEDLKPKLEEKNKEFVNQLDEFNRRFLKILSQADSKQKYVPEKEIETIKYSSFNAKFVEYILTEKLVYAIKELIKVGHSFIRQNTMNLDIIKFRITDLMRCQVSGNKKDILQIYNNFQRLDEEGKIEIIKIKNRLSTPLNDAMLIFVMKGSWIICEAQLILSETKGKVDKKSKNTELVNHYFYELERSPYGIMTEIAVLLTYKDSKILYENKISFNQSEVDIEKCKEKHQSSVMEIQEQNIPFICSKCSSFYPKSKNLFRFYQCKECKTEVCSKCILKRNPQLENSFIMKNINHKLQEKLTELEKSSKQRSGKSKNGNEKITPKLILDLFYTQRLKFKDIFDKNHKKNGIRKVQCSELMNKLSDKYEIDRRDDPKYFLVVNFSRGEAEFKLYSYHPRNKEIQNTSDPRQKHEESSYFSYSEYDLLFMLYYECNHESAIKDKHFFLFLTHNELQAKMEHIKKLKAQGKINKHENYQIISVQLNDSGTELILDYAAIKEKKKDNQDEDEKSKEDNSEVVEKKEFKYSSLAVLGERLPALKSARTSIQFDDFGIQTKHLDYFRDLSWRQSIKELKLANNKLEDVTIVFDSLNSLQRFYFNDNYVKQLRINKPIFNLEIINGSKNYIASIQGLSNIKKIKKLLLQNNRLKSFPKCDDLTVLNVLNLKANYLSNISSILNSEFPELQHLIVSQQMVESRKFENEESEKEGQGFGALFEIIQRMTRKQELMVIEYPKLKNFQSQSNNNLMVARQIAFQSQNLQKISLNNCFIDKIVFNKRQCMQNLKYLHLSGNKIQYFSFLSASQPRINRLSRDDSMANDSLIDNKPVSNENLIELVLSNNQIQYLPVMKFSSLKRLELQGNKIAEIKSFQKSKIYELQYLDLGNNPFTKICKMYFPKLTTLHLEQMKQLQNVDSLFKGPSQLPCLQSLLITNCQKIDFTFDLNQKNNCLTKLKELHFNGVNFTSLKKQRTIFESSTIESLTLDNCIFNDFPVFKLPKITSLIFNSVCAQSFKNLQNCNFPQLTSFSMKCVIQNRDNSSILSNDINESREIRQNITDLSKFFTCVLNFPKLKDLSLVSCKIGSLKGLEKHCYNELESLELKDLEMIDKQFPKIKAPNIKSIEIIGIPISNIDDFLGSGFFKLTNLHLEGNGIETIHQNTLGRLTQIETLSIINNKLKKFSCNKYLNKLINLNLSLNELKSCPRIKAKNLSEIKWQGNVFTDLNELQNCDLPALEIISFENCDLSNSGFPKLNMVRLQTLNITESKLKDVQNLSKSYLPSLRSLNLKKNEIVDFPIINVPKLEYLCLQENKINNLQFLRQSKLEILSILDLDSNMFFRFPNDLQLAHLKYFYCSHTKLKTLPALEFPELCEIRIQHAQLTDISQFAKGEYKSLNYLNLCNNKITHFPRVEMESLIIVVIDYNQINDLSDFFDSDLPLMEFQWLSFEYNNIKKVPNIMFKNVRSVFFRGNPLTEFNSLTLPEYPELYGLYLKQTQISKLNLPRLPKLEILEMDGSKVEDLDWLMILEPHLPMLSKICMKDCRITTLPNMDQFQSLTELQITGNPIKNVEEFLSSKLILNKNFELLDLDVGSDFEMLKEKIAKLNSQVKVQLYKAPEEKIEQ